MAELKLISFNARSICNKLHEFQAEIVEFCHPHIISICETWLTEDHPDSLFQCARDYNVYRCDRNDRAGGGVAVLVHNSIKSTLLSTTSTDGGEIMWVLIENASSNILIGNFYRSNVTLNNPLDKFFTELESLIPIYHDIVLTGDFNLPNIDWNVPTAPSLYKQDEVLEKVTSLGFQQYVLENTRGQNVLDLIFSNNYALISNVVVDDPLSTSDHLKIMCSLNFKPNILCENYRNWNKCFTFGFERYLEFVPWGSIFQKCKNVDEMYESFLKIFNEGVNTFVPVTKRKVNNKTMSKNTHRLLLLRRKALRRYRLTNSLHDKGLFNQYSMAFSQAVINDVRNREKAILKKPNTRKFFNFVKSKTKVREQTPTLQLPDGSLVTDAGEKAKLFSEVFSSFYVADNGTPFSMQDRMASTMPDFIITQKMVLEALKSSPNKFTCGPDGIPSFALRRFSDQLCVPLRTIFERSLKEQCVPTAWRVATITPLYKGKGPKSDPKNYRPISLTSNVCKAMEKIVKNEILKFAKATNLISASQHGFMERRSTLTQLLECFNVWTKNIDSGTPIDVIYLDIAKAFDSVSHPKLLECLENMGIRGTLLNWLSNFLANRTQTVCVDGCMSDKCDVCSGVPQGSVLGPILFILYINFVTFIVKHVDLRMYADDCKVFFQVNSKENFELLKNDVLRIYEYFCEAQLSLALHKCQVLHLGFSNPCLSMSMNNATFEDVTLVKDLGVFVSSDLKPSSHIDSIVCGAKRRMNCIFRSFVYKEEHFLSNLFCTYVRPLLEYNSPAWNPHLIKDINKIEGVQREFTRRIPGLSEIHYLDRLKHLKLETLELRRLKADLILVYKIINGLVDLKFDDFFKLSTCTTTRGHSLRLVLPKVRLDVRKNFFSSRTVNVWNILPETVVTALSVNGFKTGLNDVCFSDYLKFSC